MDHGTLIVKYQFCGLNFQWAQGLEASPLNPTVSHIFNLANIKKHFNQIYQMFLFFIFKEKLSLHLDSY